jgi:prepilin-type N-terminal cleavage/methylation domain-containing protein
MRATVGMTLLEVLVVLALLGIAAGLAAVSMPRPAATPLDAPRPLQAQLRAIREEAMRTGRARTALLHAGSTRIDVTALPSGELVLPVSLPDTLMSPTVWRVDAPTP